MTSTIDAPSAPPSPGEQSLDRQAFLDRIQPLLPGIRERAAATEELGRIPDDTVGELTDAGVFAGLQPRAWGGLELDPATFFEGVVLIGSACASTGWVTSVLGVHPWEIASMDPEAQAEVWEHDSTTRISSSYAPTGSARRDGADYLVDGWWGFSSGCDHADWALVAALVQGEEKLGPRVFLVSRDDYTIDQSSWDVTGLAGTGSKAITVDNARIPPHRTHLLVEFNDPSHERPGWQLNDGTLYRFTFLDLFSWGIGGPALGAARGFAEEWVAQSRDRVPAMGGPAVAEKPEVRLRLAEGLNRIEMLERGMRSAWSDAYAVLERGDDPDPVDERRLHYQGCRTIADSLDAVLGMFATSGGGVMYRSNPLQRFLRDLLAMRNHPVANLERFALDLSRAVFA